MQKEVSKDIWKNILQKSIKPFLWHFDYSSIKSIEKGTAFKVCTDFLKGEVKIQKKDSGSFVIHIKPANFGSELTFDDVKSEEVVSTINQVLVEGIITQNPSSLKYGVAV